MKMIMTVKIVLILAHLRIIDLLLVLMLSLLSLVCSTISYLDAITVIVFQCFMMSNERKCSYKMRNI